MASQDKLRTMFNEMNLEQKGNFIDNLKKSLEGSDDAESVEFLNECIAHYTMEKDFMDSMAQEEAAAAGAEPKPEPEPEVETVDEAVVEDVVEPEPEVEIELEAEDVVEAEAEIDVEIEAAPELEVETVVEVMVDPDLEEVVVDVELEIEAEPELDTEVIVEPEPEVEPIEEPELEAELEFEAELELEIEPEPELMLEPEIEPETELEPEPTALTTTKNKIDHIETEISDLADNIRYKMSVIATISHLLSGTGGDIVKAVAELQNIEPLQALDDTSDYENEVENIEVSITQFADSIRHDITVMEAISNLLSGK